MPWSTPFPKPLRVQDVELATLDDARKLIKLLPKPIKERPAWKLAHETIGLAAKGEATPGSAAAAVFLAIQLSHELQTAQ